MVNVFRPNYFSIGAKLLKGIQDNFPGITKEWLLTPHDAHYIFPEIQKIKQTSHRAGTYENEPEEPYRNIQTVKISDPLIQKTAAILESSTVYATALKSNIEAFHHAMTCEEQLAVASKRIDDLEEHVKQIEKRLPKAVNGS
jgi:ribosomal protein S15P/S13E